MEITLQSLAAHKIWVAWLLRDDRKIPHEPRTLRWAKANDASGWTDRAAAEVAAAALTRPSFGVKPVGGIGVEFADLGNGRSLGGVDFDTCRDQRGEIAPWARSALALLNTYTEVSPSGTGLKSFFTYDTADLPRLRKAMGATRDACGRAWTRGAGKHPPSIELFIRGKYFTVTEQHLSDTPTTLAHLTFATLRKLITEIGPAFASQQVNGRDEPDASPSGAAYRFVLDLRRRTSAKFDDLLPALEASADPQIADWLTTHARRLDQHLKYLWDKTAERAERLRDHDRARTDLSDMIEEFNNRYMVVNETGRALVYEEYTDAMLNRRCYVPITFEDLRKLYLNRRVNVGVDKSGAPITRPVGAAWLEHPQRRQYLSGVVFDPTASRVKPDQLNLWRGLAYAPRPGSWARLRDHIRDVICDRDPVIDDYLIRLLARTVQRPGEQGEIAVVMQGEEGVGKGILATVMVKLFGQHGFKINNSEHLVGKFNGHLQDCVVLYADEAFWAGDRKHAGILKAMITDEVLPIEDKFKRAIQARNHVHLFMASNEDWVVPASINARRFLVLKVSAARRGDAAYFQAIIDELESGGYEAMLHDLLAVDLASFNHRAVPSTAGLTEQKKLSLDPLHQWWLAVLERGYVMESRHEFDSVLRRWYRSVPTAILHDAYLAAARAAGDRRPVTRETLGRFLSGFGFKRCQIRHVIVGEGRGGLIQRDRAHGYELGTLAEAREALRRVTGFTVDEPNDEPPEDLDVSDAPRTDADLAAFRQGRVKVRNDTSNVRKIGYGARRNTGTLKKTIYKTEKPP